MYHNFIGVNINKNDFHVAVYGTKSIKIFDNNQHGFNELLQALKAELYGGLVALETTGDHEIKLIEFLQAAKISVHRANTRMVKLWQQWLGQNPKVN